MALVQYGASQAVFGADLVTFGPYTGGLVALTIAYTDTAPATIDVPSYTVVDAREDRAIRTRSGRRWRPYRTRASGDKLALPQPLTVIIHVNEGSFAASVNAAFGILAKAQLASSVVTHRGTVSTLGVHSHSLSASGMRVDLRLVFRVVRPYEAP